MRIRTHYYRQFDADYSLEVPAEGYGGWSTAEVDIAPEHTAIVVMHAWDCGTPEEYPGWFRACDEIPRTYQVCREVFPMLLPAVRQSPFRLFHVVGGSGYYEHYPGYQRAVKLASPEKPAVPGADPDPCYHQLQKFRRDLVFPGRHNQADAARGWSRIAFPKEAEPHGDEGIARNAHQLFALCRDAGINHLIYAGFNINWCLLISAGGMVDMSRRGMICSCFRDAVTAVENKESARNGWGKELALWRVSVEFGFVFEVGDFVQQIQKLQRR